VSSALAVARRPLVAGNWKMHLVRAEAERICRELLAEPLPAAVDVALLPSHPLLVAVAAALAGSAVTVGGQDLHATAEGAFTGDVSGRQLADAGCRWVLCGHSERRRDHVESDELVARKAAAALAVGLAPIVCVGETRDERHSGRTFDVLARQVEALPLDRRLVVAYEPVWAIGTGETATVEMAEDAHAYLRARVARRAEDSFAAGLRLLYGGSVTPTTPPSWPPRARSTASWWAAPALTRSGFELSFTLSPSPDGATRTPVIYLLYTLHVILCLFLILVVLLQQGKGADLSVFGGGSTMTAFGARGATTLLHRLTVGGFIGFVLTTLLIAYLQASSQGASVMSKVPASAPVSAPVAAPAQVSRPRRKRPRHRRGAAGDPRARRARELAPAGTGN
jgi:triosephosphate isomerase (TIM)